LSTACRLNDLGPSAASTPRSHAALLGDQTSTSHHQRHFSFSEPELADEGEEELDGRELNLEFAEGYVDDGYGDGTYVLEEGPVQLDRLKDRLGP
jgi:hypothetical protein